MGVGSNWFLASSFRALPTVMGWGALCLPTCIRGRPAGISLRRHALCPAVAPPASRPPTQERRTRRNNGKQMPSQWFILNWGNPISPSSWLGSVVWPSQKGSLCIFSILNYFIQVYLKILFNYHLTEYYSEIHITGMMSQKE